MSLSRTAAAPRSGGRPVISGKFFHLGEETFLVKGVTYGTFAPAADGQQYPTTARVQQDFALMAGNGINTVRVYTPPRPDVLEAAAAEGLRLMVGVPWTQHVAFLDDAKLTREIRREVASQVRRLGADPNVLLFALGNEIPPAVVRWHGKEKVERFLRELLADAREAAPDSYFTYVNYPPTEFLDTDAFDVMSVNVYLHDPARLRAYLARLQHVAGHKPLLLAEAGADSIREGEEGQAALTAMHLRIAFQEGACGAMAYAWTDEWWRGGQDVTDWKFGLVDAERRPKPALFAVNRAFADAPFPESAKKNWPKVSVVVCAYNAADTLEDCLRSLKKLDYPDFEVILVNDGSRDQTPQIARAHEDHVRVIDVYPNGGLSAARNVGMHAATGEIVAYTDADVRVDRDWLTYLVQPFINSDVVGSGGPNVVPGDDPWIAQCVARAPGGPTQVLLDDRIAEHVPGCNMAFRRDALMAIGGFNPIYLRAGDDVDVCWRLQARGGKIGFAPSALVWHHHRASVKAYWRQQMGYGEGELWLVPQHPEKFAGGHMLWRGRIYSALPFVRGLVRMQVNAGLWGQAPFPSVYHTGVPGHVYLPHSPQWLGIAFALLALGLGGLLTPFLTAALAALGAGAGMFGLTAARCLGYARQSDLAGLAPVPGYSPRASRWLYRGMIAWLHFLQPVARLRGLLRGLMNPPNVVVPDPLPGPARHGWPSPSEVWGAVRMLVGDRLGSRYWGETWTSVEAVLHGILKELRAARGVSVGVDEGWQHDRDLSVALGPWARLDLKALVEEHAGGRVLLRVATRMRLTLLGALALLGVAGAMALASYAEVSSHWPLASLLGVALLLSALSVLFSRLVRASAALRRAVLRTAAVSGMAPITAPAPARSAWPRRLALGLRGAAAAALIAVASTTVGGIVQGALPARLAAPTAPVVVAPALPAPAAVLPTVPVREQRRGPRTSTRRTAVRPASVPVPLPARPPVRS